MSLKQLECPVCNKHPRRMYTVCEGCFDELQAHTKRLERLLERTVENLTIWRTCKDNVHSISMGATQACQFEEIVQALKGTK